MKSRELDNLKIKSLVDYKGGLSDYQTGLIAEKMGLISNGQYEEAVDCHDTYGVGYKKYLSTFVGISNIESYSDTLDSEEIERQKETLLYNDESFGSSQFAIMSYHFGTISQTAYEKTIIAKNDYGIDEKVFISAYNTLADVESDKDVNGDYIKGRKAKDKKLSIINSMPISLEQKGHIASLSYEKTWQDINWGKVKELDSEYTYNGIVSQYKNASTNNSTNRNDKYVNEENTAFVKGESISTGSKTPANFGDFTLLEVGRGKEGIANATQANSFIEKAKEALGTKYVWGGQDMKGGIDCSGLIIESLKQSGVKNIKDTTAQGLYNQSVKINADKAQKGDLIFFEGTSSKSGNKVTHVGIYLGNGKVLDAQSKGVVIEDINTNYWNKFPQSYGRILDVSGKSTSNVTGGKIGDYSPVDYSTLNTGYMFGDPKSGGRSGTHKGSDFSVLPGTPVTAVASGKVVFAGKNKSSAYGNSDIVDMGNGYYYQYNHLSDWGVGKGDIINAGDVICKSGNVGSNNKGKGHLEIEVYKGSTDYGNQIDPIAFFGWGDKKSGTVISSGDTSNYTPKGTSGSSGNSGKSSKKSGGRSGGRKSGSRSSKAKLPTIPNFNFDYTPSSMPSSELPKPNITKLYQKVASENSSNNIIAKYMALAKKYS